MGVYKSQLASRGEVQPHLYFCDLSAEMPSSGLQAGADILFCHQDKCWYVASSATQWAGASISGGVEGGGPHTHPISDVTDLQTALDGKSDTSHTHPGGGPTTVKITADLAANTAIALANATGLLFAVTAGTYYHFKFYITFRSAATTTGIRLGLTFPAITVFSATANIPIAADGAGGLWQGWITSSGDAVVGTGVQAANTDYLAIVEGNILPSASGNLQLQFATEIAASAVTIRQGSCGVLYSM